jgi:hypothetical protein
VAAAQVVPAATVAVALATPPPVELPVDWRRLAKLGRGPVLDVGSVVGTLPAAPAIAAAVEAALPPLTLPVAVAAVTVTVPQVPTVTVAIPPGP